MYISFKEESFSNKLNEIFGSYTNDIIEDEKNEIKIESPKMKFPSFINYIVKNSIFQKFNSLVLNRNFIVLLCCLSLLILIKRKLNDNRKILDIIMKLLHYINSFRAINTITKPLGNLLMGIFTLLINY
jgi:hypothetical protein